MATSQPRARPSPAPAALMGTRPEIRRPVVLATQGYGLDLGLDTELGEDRSEVGPHGAESHELVSGDLSRQVPQHQVPQDKMLALSEAFEGRELPALELSGRQHLRDQRVP